MLIFLLGELCFIWVHRKGRIEGCFSQQVHFPTTRIYLQELPEKEFQIFNNTYLVLCHKMWGYMVIIGVNFYLCNNSMSTEKNSMNTVVLLCLYGIYILPITRYCQQFCLKRKIPRNNHPLKSTTRYLCRSPGESLS